MAETLTPAVKAGAPSYRRCGQFSYDEFRSAYHAEGLIKISAKATSTKPFILPVIWFQWSSSPSRVEQYTAAGHVASASEDKERADQPAAGPARREQRVQQQRAQQRQQSPSHNTERRPVVEHRRAAAPPRTSPRAAVVESSVKQARQ